MAHPLTPSAPSPQPGRLPSGKAASCTVFKHGHATDVSDRLGQISNILEEEGTLVWFDVVDPGPNDLDVLREEFDLHPLAIEDAIQAHQRPKIESYVRYWFLDVQATSLEGEEVEFHEVAIFAGTNFIVTVRHSPAYRLDEIKERWNAHREGMDRGAGFLLYTILDTVVDGYIPVAEIFSDRVDALEETLFNKRPASDNQVLPEIFAMKKEAQKFRRAVLPMRDILNPIIRKDIELFPDADLDYFRDVYDHSVLVMDQLDSLRDIVNSALEIHLSVVGNRQNEVAKQLTVIATIFLPLTFLTGFFGQNFSFLVNDVMIHNWTFWLLGVGTEIMALVLTLGYFRVKGWF